MWMYACLSYLSVGWGVKSNSPEKRKLRKLPPAYESIQCGQLP